MAGRFSLDVSRFVNNTRLKMNDVVRGAMYDLASNVIRRTPVKTGRARGNWIMTMDHGPSTAQTGVLDKSGEHSLDRIALALEQFDAKRTRSIWLTNCLPYIIMLEYGWSPQSPAGIVRTSLLLFRGVKLHELGVRS